MTQFNRYYFEILPFRDDAGRLIGFTLQCDFHDMDEDTTFLIYAGGHVEMIAGNNMIADVDLASAIYQLGKEIVKHKNRENEA